MLEIINTILNIADTWGLAVYIVVVVSTACAYKKISSIGKIAKPVLLLLSLGACLFAGTSIIVLVMRIESIPKPTMLIVTQFIVAIFYVFSAYSLTVVAIQRRKRRRRLCGVACGVVVLVLAGIAWRGIETASALDDLRSLVADEEISSEQQWCLLEHLLEADVVEYSHEFEILDENEICVLSERVVIEVLPRSNSVWKHCRGIYHNIRNVKESAVDAVDVAFELADKKKFYLAIDKNASMRKASKILKMLKKHGAESIGIIKKEKRKLEYGITTEHPLSKYFERRINKKIKESKEFENRLGSQYMGVAEIVAKWNRKNAIYCPEIVDWYKYDFIDWPLADNEHRESILADVLSIIEACSWELDLRAASVYVQYLMVPVFYEVEEVDIEKL